MNAGAYFCVDSNGSARQKNSAGTAYTSSTGASAPAAILTGTTSCN